MVQVPPAAGAAGLAVGVGLVVGLGVTRGVATGLDPLMQLA